MKYESPSSSDLETQRLKFFKSRSNFKVKSLGKKLWYPWTGLVTRNAHVKNESSIYSNS